MNKYIRYISDNLIYFGINTVSFLIITPLAIKVMGLVFYGLWSILNALMLFSNIGTMGISAIVVKIASEATTDESSDREHYFGEVLTAATIIIFPMAFFVSVLIILFHNLVADNLAIPSALHGQFSSALLLIALGVFPQFLSRAPAGFLLSQLRNRIVRIIEFLSTLSLWLGAIGIVFFHAPDLRLIALWYVINSTIVLITYYILIPREIIFKPLMNIFLLRRMLKFSGYLFVETLAINLFQQMDRVIVGLTLGPAAAGVYSVGTSVGLRMSLITGQVTEVMIPFASLKDSLNDYGRLLVIFRRLSRYISLLIAVTGGLLVLWMNEILTVWISPAYASQYSGVFSLLIVAYGILSLCRPGHQTLTGMGKVKFTSIVYLFSTIAMLIGVYGLSRYFGLYGAAFANCFMILLLAFNIFCYHLLESRHFSWKQFFSDLKWGFFLPAVFFGLLFLNHTFLFKTQLTLSLVALMLVVFLRDDWVKNTLAHQFKHFYPKPSEN